MTTIALAAALLAVAYGIVWLLNRSDPARLRDTKERREMAIRREMRD